MKKYIIIVALISSFYASAQKSGSTIKGRVYNAKNNEPVEFATVVIQNTVNGINSDLNGNFLLKDVDPGFYQLKVSAIGFKTYISESFRITLAAGGYSFGRGRCPAQFFPEKGGEPDFAANNWDR